jgi:hypothetical protein
VNYYKIQSLKLKNDSPTYKLDILLNFLPVQSFKGDNYMKPVKRPPAMLAAFILPSSTAKMAISASQLGGVADLKRSS